LHYRENDASSLQQFEALLSLTNILSCGRIEQDKFEAERFVSFFPIEVEVLKVGCVRGVAAAYYLMFSDNLMVRRAATETLCNMPGHPAVIKVCYDDGFSFIPQTDYLIDFIMLSF